MQDSICDRITIGFKKVCLVQMRSKGKLSNSLIWGWSLVEQSVFDQLKKAMILHFVPYLLILDHTFSPCSDALDTHVCPVLE